MKKARGSLKVFVFAVLVMGMIAGFSLTANAAGRWHSSGSRIWYTTSGSRRAYGLRKIGSFYYYFNGSGYLQTGWVTFQNGTIRYFRKTGSLGVKGRMYAGGIRSAWSGKKLVSFGFDRYGNPLKGLRKIGSHYYYFTWTGKAGTRGRMYKNRWVTLTDKRRIYLMKNGQMAVSRWIYYAKGYYYVGPNGNKLVNTVTPDGYRVNRYGLRIGRENPSGSTENGSTGGGTGGSTGNGGTGGSTGGSAGDGSTGSGTGTGGTSTVSFPSSIGTRATTGKASVLIVCGHGQGDPGAVSSFGQEQKYTREFGSLIYSYLKSSGKVNVSMFGQNYNLFEQSLKTLGSVYVDKENKKTLQSQITGDGTYRSAVYAALKKNAVIPDLTRYDYVLEIHMNAAANKAETRDGKYKGTCMYVSRYKKNYKVDYNVADSIVKLGFRTFAGVHVFGGNLLNSRVCNEMGVSYGLLETCFIDDGDDMYFYSVNKKKMARAAADAIGAYFS